MVLYDKFPSIKVDGSVYVGWGEIIEKLEDNLKQITDSKVILCVESYVGVDQAALKLHLSQLKPALIVDSKEGMLSEREILDLTQKDVTDDAIFGFWTRLKMQDFFDPKKVEALQSKIDSTSGLIVVFGPGATIISPKSNILIYADMARWELQARQRRGEVSGLGVDDHTLSPGIQYKRGFFVDWRVCDKVKKNLFDKADYWLDTCKNDTPKMIDGSTHLAALKKGAHQPFRVVPFFDPGPWGGQWMKSVCGLDPEKQNYAWCFDCVPEENSILIEVKGVKVEVPSINMVFYQSKPLLGAAVESRFGQEFPIRFDFLDTIEGGNLSLQVHPTTQYIRDNFGMSYTQDESYYMLDATDEAIVYLGLKKGVSPDEMINELNKAQEGEGPFDADKFVNKFPAKKHDHFLIPNGTIHCSGTGSMVLEISATPYIFTFKLWDWNRLGLDGKPRPINIKHGQNVIDWNRDTEFCKKYLVNAIKPIAQGEGWSEESTGLHENEFIETRRHWFSVKTNHNTNGGVNVINLVEGDEAIVESPTNSFEPFIVHYAETFIIPASVGEYTIAPYGKSIGKKCATLKAYVRFKD